MTEFQSTLWTLVLKARDGNESALRDFTLKYRAPIIAYISRRGLAHEAEDLAQEVFLRFFKDGVLLKADPSKGRFRTLVLAVTKRVIGHHLEREHAKKRCGGSVQPLADIDVAAPDESFDREWVAHLVEVALARLAREHPNYHDALKRFLADGQPYDVIAKALAISQGDVKNFVYRGKQKLIEYLRDQIRDYSGSQAEYDEEFTYLSKFFQVR
jgi:RNA polymerase sigma factor (sigma-70 family)